MNASNVKTNIKRKAGDVRGEEKGLGGELDPKNLKGSKDILEIENYSVKRGETKKEKQIHLIVCTNFKKSVKGKIYKISHEILLKSYTMTAEKIIRVSLLSITDVYTTRCIHKANSIVDDPTQTSHTRFTLLQSGKKAGKMDKCKDLSEFDEEPNCNGYTSGVWGVPGLQWLHPDGSIQANDFTVDHGVFSNGRYEMSKLSRVT
ncbi:hypothetical protein QTP86_005123 [Hemibagrus guttatus]|nr:hypothetical protein QTP86_005123 [Hemibagrus guttatus]